MGRNGQPLLPLHVQSLSKHSPHLISDAVADSEGLAAGTCQLTTYLTFFKRKGCVHSTPRWYNMCLVAQLCPTVCDHGNSPGKNTGVGCHALFQGIVPNQGSNPDLPHCRQILHHLSHERSPRILEWVAYPFSRGFRPRNQTGASCTAGGFLSAELPEKPWYNICHYK